MADAKLSALTAAALGDLAGTDLVYAAIDPGGSPSTMASRKVPLSVIVDFVEQELNLGTVVEYDRSTDGTLAANSDALIPTQKAVKTYADQLIAAADAMVFQGVIDCSANPNYPAADAGDTYRVSVAGKIGGGSGTNVEIGDLLLCLADSTASGTQAGVGASWSIAQTNIDGAVVGPASVTDGNLAAFDGTTGKLIKEQTAAQVRTLLGLVIGTNVQAFDADLAGLAAITRTQGDLIYGGASDWADLAPGTAGQVLQTGGAGANPSWTPQILDMHLFFGGEPTASEVLFEFMPVRAMNLVASATGSSARIGINPTATHTFTLLKNGGSVGTVAFNTSGVPTWTVASQVNLNGTTDYFTITAQATPDATGADISLGIKWALN